MRNWAAFGVLLALLFSCHTNSSNDYKISTISYPESLHVVLRAQWGWKALPDTLPRHQIHYITIHHGGVVYNGEKPAQQYIREMQDWSRKEKHWIDIPYHWMIDLEGRIYETRPIDYPGDTNTDYDVRGHALINVMGNYEVQKINPRQLKALIDLTTFLADSFQVDTSDIRGHRDYTETLCPGKDLYRYISDGTIRREVARRLKNKRSNK